ncbi:hypothetical protein Tco_0324788, partial [Tanacetum coccineum]
EPTECEVGIDLVREETNRVRFYPMEMDCMLSTSGWLVCEVCAYVRRYCRFLACSPERIFIKTEAEFVVVGFLFCFFYFSDSYLLLLLVPLLLLLLLLL